MADFFDSWGERIGLPGGTLLVLRVGWWLFRRWQGRPSSTPIIDWIARRLLVETALVLKDVELRVQEAENRQLRQKMRDAGISVSDEPESGSFDLPGSMLTRSRRSTRPSKPATSPSPDTDPAPSEST